MGNEPDQGCSEACANCTCGKKQQIELKERITEFNLLCETKVEGGKVIIDNELQASLKSIQSKIIEFKKEGTLSEENIIELLDKQGNQVIHRVFLKQ